MTEVEVRNVMKVSYAHIRPLGTATVIGGRNDQGKTSFLDAIAMALGGAVMCPEEPLKRGEDEGSVTVALEGEPTRHLPPMRVTRRFWRTDEGEHKSALTVVSDDAFRSAPGEQQRLLSSLVSFVTFDPMKFMSAKPKDQFEKLTQLAGLNLDAEDAAIAREMESRKDLKKDLARVKSEGETLRDELTVPYEKVPDEEVSPDEIVERLNAANAHNAEVANAESSIYSLVSQVEAATLSVTKAEKDEASAAAEVQRLTKALAEAKAEKKAVSASVKEAKKVLDTKKSLHQSQVEKVGKMERRDTEPILSELNKVSETNAAVSLKRRINAKRDEYRAVAGLVERADKKIETLREKKLKKIAEAKWPIEGLSVNTEDKVVLYNGFPLSSQTSVSSQMKVGIAIGAALNPNLKLIIVRDASLLDEESLQEVVLYAAERGFQLFVERVGSGAECHIVMKDGVAEVIEEACRPSGACEQAIEGEE